ncbi:Ran-binding protein [Dirofilaria immitis]
MAMEVEVLQNDFDDAILDDIVEVKSLSPDPALRRRRPRYKVICAGERPNEVNERLLQLYPFVDQKKTPLPTHWSHQDKAASLIVTNDYRNVTYVDNGDPNQELNAKDAAAVRADHPIPITCGVYYFEVTIVCSGAECCMGVGLCERNVDLNRLPGWDRASYGYHGDDGNFFCSSGTGHAYGPTFKMNDVIGCGVDFVRKSIFFTKNGRHLGIAIMEVENVVDLYPMIGLQKHGAIAESNFGQYPFKYDIEQEFKDARNYTYEQICQVVLPQAKTGWMDRAISSWLLHEGYGRALAAFKKHADQNLDETGDVQMERGDEESNDMLEKRRELKQMILDGEVGKAVERVRALFPNLLEQNKELALLLNCQYYVEIYAKANNITISSVSSRDSSNNMSPKEETRPTQSSLSAVSGGDSYAQVYSRKGHPFTITASNENLGTINPFKRRNDEWEPFICVTRRSRTGNEGMQTDSSRFARVQTSNTVIRNTSTDEIVDDKVASDYSSSSNGAVHVSNGNATTSNGVVSNGVSQPVTSATTIIDEDQDPSCGDTHQDVIGGAERTFTLCRGWTGGDPKDMMGCTEIDRLLQLGREINCLCQQIVNPPEDLVRRMHDILALICHTKPLETSLRYLLEQMQRVRAANGLNSALREHMGFPKESLLSMHFRTARKLRSDLSAMQLGAAVFADVDKLVLYNFSHSIVSEFASLPLKARCTSPSLPAERQTNANFGLWEA